MQGNATHPKRHINETCPFDSFGGPYCLPRRLTAYCSERQPVSSQTSFVGSLPASDADGVDQLTGSNSRAFERIDAGCSAEVGSGNSITSRCSSLSSASTSYTPGATSGGVSSSRISEVSSVRTKTSVSRGTTREAEFSPPDRGGIGLSSGRRSAGAGDVGDALEGTGTNRPLLVGALFCGMLFDGT